MNFIKNFLRDEEGVTAIEYALVAALVVTVVIAVVGTDGTGALGSAIKAAFGTITTAIDAI
jgi:pilus assembly protein Flp/PilA